MNTITDTSLWRRTLGSEGASELDQVAREKLRSCYVAFRGRAGLLAAEIHRDLPDFTVHDITHLDALWEVADLVGGSELEINPAEAFVLGGSFLLHDLGMSLAAYPQGLEELKRRQTWTDTVSLQFMEEHNRQPTAEELAAPPPEIVRAATGYLLRSLHAEQAERLGMVSWSASADDAPQYLIEDTDIRQSFGRIVGLVAHSHWWPVHELEQRFPRTLGAPHWCPKEWTVDPLKLACLLRLSDAGHIDARRAPYFLRAIRRISGFSEAHWAFQQRMGKPHLSGDALSYTSGYAFPFDESAAWWVCFDTLRMIDDELRCVDALLGDKGMNRFAARRVAGIESPERLTSYVPTAGWTPVDASVQVSDVPRLLTCLGGKELYGQDLKVPVRELVQNASDALRARWAVEGRPEGWGKVCVRLGQDTGGHWLEVHDDGIGMSPTVLTKYLLDFSTTFWGSTAMIDELPGLLGSGFRPTGKYGIGFFSVFMLGDAVRIRTRRADAAQKDTLVLEFNTGLSSRPVLRKADDDEILRDGGTCIRVWLRSAPTDKGGVLHRFGDHPPYSLAQLCKELCPAVPITLTCAQDGADATVIEADDWQDCSGPELFLRTYDWMTYDTDDYEGDNCSAFIVSADANLRLLREADGSVVGRACVALERRRSSGSRQTASLRGVVVIGGLAACRLNGIAGVFVGTSERAARDTATPVVSSTVLSEWATEQASLVPALYDDPEDQLRCAVIVRRCGGETGDLPVARHAGAYVSSRDIANLTLPDRVLLLSSLGIDDIEGIDGFEFIPGVIVTETGTWMSILQSRSFVSWPDNLNPRWGGPFSVSATVGGCVVEAVAEAWSCPLDTLAQQVKERSRRRDEQVIGHVGSQEIKKDVLVLERPTDRCPKHQSSSSAT